MLAKQWFEKGEYYSVKNHQVFVIDSARFDVNAFNKPNLCILHGFPTSSFDYFKVLDVLAEHYRVVVYDHIGFGYSDKPINYSYSLVDQTDIALLLWQQLNIQSTHILAHDYGTSILTELLARDNHSLISIKLNKIILCNGSMHIELAKLRLMQKLLRNPLLGKFVAKLSTKKTLCRNLKNIYIDPSKINPEEIETIWELMTFNEGRNVLAKISQYTFERKRLWHRWIGALQETNLPIEIIWPDKDPIAIAKMANVINQETKNSRLHWLDNVGHFPMLEDPKQWTKIVLNSLSR